MGTVQFRLVPQDLQLDAQMGFLVLSTLAHLPEREMRSPEGLDEHPWCPAGEGPLGQPMQARISAQTQRWLASWR